MLSKLDKTLRESALFNGNRSVKEPATLEEILDSETGIFILKELKDEFKVERERLWYELDAEWDRMIRVEVDRQANPLAAKIMINRHCSDQSHFDKFNQFSTLKLSQPAPVNGRLISFVFLNKLKQFAAQFLNFCSLAVINNPDLFEIQVVDDAEYKTICFVQNPQLKSEI